MSYIIRPTVQDEYSSMIKKQKAKIRKLILVVILLLVTNVFSVCYNVLLLNPKLSIKKVIIEIKEEVVSVYRDITR